MKKISVVFGTRPEAIKLAPVILELKKHSDLFDVNICVTAQHRQMLDKVLEVFEIKPDVDLNLMKPNQTLASLTSKAITELDQYYKNFSPDLVLVQGDTTTVFAATLAAFFNKIKIGHVEAGLRTRNKYSPFPEEINRVLTTHIADLHFTPTEKSKRNLLGEGIEEDKIFVTGNTVIDALKIAKLRVENELPKIPGIPNYIMKSSNKIILITGHRRENFGEGFENICHAIKSLAVMYPETYFIYPVHLNPNVQKPVKEILSNLLNVFLIEPLDYLPFVRLMMKSYLILTDSGGVQEEAPSLGIPVLVMREITERPEALESGTVRLVGTDKTQIFNEVTQLIENKISYLSMCGVTNPYGDGFSAQKIVSILDTH